MPRRLIDIYGPPSPELARFLVIRLGLHRQGQPHRRGIPVPDSTPPRRPLATPQELADYVGVPLATVYQWSSRGGGPKLIKVGRHLRARWTDIEAWLDTQTTGSGS
jgi:excisionase family DNA binding protein